MGRVKNLAETIDSKRKSKNEKFALISVSDKTGIVEFAKAIVSCGYRIVSTGGTAKTLAENKIPVIPIQDITGNPESFDGRMKTISFQIESGILFDRKKASHVNQAKELGIKSIEIVVCNLYPFEKTIMDWNVTQDKAIEAIDVGGPTMVRSAAKNFQHVLVVVDPNDYESIGRLLLKQNLTLAKREELAAKAFYHLSFYDSQIAKYLNKEDFPDEITLPGRKVMDLRYGENPHQKAAFYITPNANSSLEKLQKVWGRDLSMTNLTDISAGIESVRLFRQSAAVIVKHNNPCGIALAVNSKQALSRAIEADPESAFGGVIVLNKTMDLQTAKVIGEYKEDRHSNIDIVAIPEINTGAFEYLKKVRKSMGIYVFGQIPKIDSQNLQIKGLDGGFILQTPDNEIEKSFREWKVVTKIKPSKKQLEQMKIAWKFISRIKSNAVIVVDKELPMTRGIGTGQTSRIRSTKIALSQAGSFTKGAILASDSFFPFDDSVKHAAKHNIAASVQQGGSVNDQSSIDAANKAGIVMVMTGRREFWH